MSQSDLVTDVSTTAVDNDDSGLWAVRALTLLLFLEMLFLLALEAGGLYVAYLNGQPQPLPAYLQLSETAYPMVVGAGVALGVVAVLTLGAALAFLLHWRIGWQLALLAQSLMLMIGVALFFYNERFLTFALMGVGIFMVAYLHHPDVQTSFQTRPAATQRTEVL